MMTSRARREARSSTQRNDLLQIAEMELKRDRAQRFMCDWKEDSRGVLAACVQKVRHVQGLQELTMASKELVATRRAELRHLLEEENRQYREELHRLGKTLYLQRL